MNEYDKNFAESHAVLVALLLDIGEPTEVKGMDGLSDGEKIFLLGSCCVDLIAEVLWKQTGNDCDMAIEGVRALMDDVVDNINSRRVPQ